MFLPQTIFDLHNSPSSLGKPPASAFLFADQTKSLLTPCRTLIFQVQLWEGI